jgi:hypothetical protein
LNSSINCAAQGAVTWVHHVANCDLTHLVVLGSNLVLAGGCGFVGNGSTTSLGGPTYTIRGGCDVVLGKFDKATGNFQTSTQYGGGAAEYPNTMAVSPDGNVFLEGVFGFDGSAAAANLGGADLPYAGGTGNDIFLAQYAADFTPIWSRRIGDTDDDQPGGTADLDTGDSAYSSGKTRGTVDFGTGAMATVGDSDGFYVRYDSGRVGKQIYYKDAGYTYTEGVLSVLGTTVLAGSFGGSVTLGGTTVLSSRGGIDAFAAGYNSAGTLQWNVQIGGAGDEQSLVMARDTLGHVFVAGGFTQSMVIPTVSGNQTLTSNGGTDVFLLRINSAGTVDWATSFGGPGNDGVNAIACPTGDQLVVAGSFFSQVNFGSGVRTANGSSRDAYVAVFAGANGAARWDHTFGGTLDDYGLGVAVDTDGTVYASIDFQSTVDFGTGPLTVPSGQFDTAVVRLTK